MAELDTLSARPLRTLSAVEVSAVEVVEIRSKLKDGKIELLLPKENLQRNTGKLELIAQAVFQKAFVAVGNVLRKVAEKGKSG